MIYICGDSHCLMFWGANNAVLNYVGAATAYGLGNSSSRTGARNTILEFFSKASTNKDDIVIFVFGEIDCRIHVYRIALKTNKSYSEIISNALDRYFGFLSEIKKVTDAKIVLLGLPTTTIQGNHYKYDHYGSWAVRNSIRSEWQSQLKQRIGSAGYEYAECGNRFSDRGGHILPRFTMDGTHLNTVAGGIVIQEIRDRLTKQTTP